MNYNFPLIKNISDVLPHVKDREEFVVAVRDGYTIINYNMLTSDTFRPFTGEDDLGNAIRRECRGIIFDNDSGKIIRRPYHKFFNVNEREETLSENLDISKEHHILEKLDGSMIAPFFVNDEIVWGTKMAAIDFHTAVNIWVQTNENYRVLAQDMITSGQTPIFEWLSPESRIVIEHKEPQLVLTAIRDMRDGTYHHYEDLKMVAERYDVECVKANTGTYQSMQDIADQTYDVVGQEGYVIRWNDGQMAKVKSSWYLAIHKAKEKLLYERYVVGMIIDEKIDDVLPFLLDSDREKLMKYSTDFWSHFVKFHHEFSTDVWHDVNCLLMTRKEWALEKSKQYGSFASVVFKHFDYLQNDLDLKFDDWDQTSFMALEEVFRAACTSNSRLESFKKANNIELVW